MYLKKPNPVTSSSENAAISIDISSDEEDSSPDNNEESKTPSKSTFVPPPPQLSPGLKITNGAKPTNSNENNADASSRPGPASQKKRKIENSPQQSATESSSGKPASSSSSQYQASKPKKFKKEVYAKSSSVTFADVGGADKVLRELCELILHIKHPEMYKHIGLPPPRFHDGRTFWFWQEYSMEGFIESSREI
jgi:ribosome biogenesis ATPase